MKPTLHSISSQLGQNKTKIILNFSLSQKVQKHDKTNFTLTIVPIRYKNKGKIIYIIS